MTAHFPRPSSPFSFQYSSPRGWLWGQSFRFHPRRPGRSSGRRLLERLLHPGQREPWTLRRTLWERLGGSGRFQSASSSNSLWPLLHAGWSRWGSPADHQRMLQRRLLLERRRLLGDELYSSVLGQLQRRRRRSWRRRLQYLRRENRLLRAEVLRRQPWLSSGAVVDLDRSRRNSTGPVPYRERYQFIRVTNPLEWSVRPRWNRKKSRELVVAQPWKKIQRLRRRGLGGALVPWTRMQRSTLDIRTTPLRWLPLGGGALRLGSVPSRRDDLSRRLLRLRRRTRRAQARANADRSRTGRSSFRRRTKKRRPRPRTGFSMFSSRRMRFSQSYARRGVPLVRRPRNRQPRLLRLRRVPMFSWRSRARLRSAPSNPRRLLRRCWARAQRRLWVEAHRKYLVRYRSAEFAGVRKQLWREWLRWWPRGKTFFQAPVAEALTRPDATPIRARATLRRLGAFGLDQSWRALRTERMALRARRAEYRAQQSALRALRAAAGPDSALPLFALWWNRRKRTVGPEAWLRQRLFQGMARGSSRALEQLEQRLAGVASEGAALKVLGPGEEARCAAARALLSRLRRRRRP